MTSIAVPNMVSSLEQMNTSPGTYAAIDLANASLLVSVHMDHQEKFAFHQQIQQYTYRVLPQGYINSPILCLNLIISNLDHFPLPQNITLVHYIDGVMLVGQSEQELAITLDLTFWQHRGTSEDGK